jgi:hypothetical protein
MYNRSAKKASGPGSGPWAHLVGFPNAPPDPTTSLIRGKARWHTQECLSTLGLSWFDQKAEMKLPWIHGPIVIDLGGNYLICHATTIKGQSRP